MNIQETIDSLKQQVEDLQKEVNDLRWESSNNIRPLGDLYSVATSSGTHRKIFPYLHEAVEYYSTLRQRLLDKQSSGSRSTVELELHKAPMLVHNQKWKQL